MSNSNNGGYKCLCPACGERMKIKTIRRVSPTEQTMVGQCTDFLCSASFIGTMSIDASVSPSKLENPAVQLPSVAERKKEHATRRKEVRTTKTPWL